MKALVTGANGYLGQGVVTHLLNHGIEVIATDFQVNNVDERAKLVKCNLFEIDSPYSFFDCPDILLHLAWKDGFVHFSNTHIEDLPKHYYFLKHFAESDVKMISVMGTMHEIGFFEGSIDENTPCNPITPYGISKNSLRQLTQMLCKQHGKKYQWLRGYYIVGNSNHGASIFSKIASAESEGKVLFPFTTGQNQYDFIDYEDCCEQIARTVEQDSILGIINICCIPIFNHCFGI